MSAYGIKRLCKLSSMVGLFSLVILLNACTTYVTPTPNHWIPGHWNAYGRWIPGHFVGYGPAHTPEGGMWIPGHWNGNVWISGHWRG